MATVVLDEVRKSFGSVETIHGVNLDIQDREFVVFVGPSGCGKSTLLRLVAGLEDITSGDLMIDGNRVNALPPAKRGIAMVFQSYALYPHMSVYENMAFGLRRGGASNADVEKQVKEAARILELEPLLDRLPKNLSGGQRQRVAIGRAIVRDPKVFLFDEPLSNLDAALRVQTRLEIAKLHRRMDATMIYVTHDQVEAMTLADRIVVLNAGNVEQFGTPLDLYHRPENQFVATFLGSPTMNILDATLGEATDQSARVMLPDTGDVSVAASVQGMTPGTPVRLGMRPEHLRLADANTADFSGTVDVVEELGESHLVHVIVPHGDRIVVRATGDARVKEGENVGIAFDPNDGHLFRADGVSLPRTGPASETDAPLPTQH
ncbi:sn-glycerol-3-phosphate ABC transporter ATP-binding protein UgpC [Acuticoccus sp. MNP-M23]|uniref:ABC transporter ATP-binding protein n=1 Tax=Acuticoccus sp. MNP-M23 TaxID=3072793 RepID=UPI002814EB16|nr:sn-glycerol-3-phosphate ABC transporter ATP-binding protein UgpC [Acuticoccus sp. MNP-M23]WMS43979.1 sn-glycerol-3-phosphate ABC transporter ATP-binding protein UgpC [Acuticoccus sp. MNP-M23]